MESRIMKNEPEEIFGNSILPDEKLTGLPTSAGLILFADSQNTPILLMTAANIRRTVKNKLAREAEKTKKADLKSIAAKIYYTTCPCRFRLAMAHYKAAKKIFGQNYKDHINFVWPTFIKTDLNEKIPFFSVTKKPAFKEGEKILGPFAGQKAAAIFLSVLEDTFKLCKRNDFMNNPQQTAGCPYLQMEACCGVCAGKISSEDYKNIIKDAFEAGANPQKTIEKLSAEMEIASKELQFERAAELKRKIEKLNILKKQAYRWTGDLEKLKIVHIDKSMKVKLQDSRKKEQTYAVFAINFFEIIDCGDFVIETAEKIAEVIENALAKLNILQETCDNTEKQEQFAIVSYFLYRTKPAGVWISASGGFDRKKLQENLFC